MESSISNMYNFNKLRRDDKPFNSHYNKVQKSKLDIKMQNS